MSKCRYKSMGLKECAETPGLYACSPCREISAFERNETIAASAGPLGKLRDMSAEERARLIGTISDTLSQRSPLQEYIAKIERDILNSAAVPHFVLMGTASYGAATAMEVEAQRYTTKWQVPGALLDAEERRQRRDDHVDALGYAMTAQGIWCAANGTWSCARTDSHIRAMCRDGRVQGIPASVSAAHPSPFGPVQPAAPMPPTLREWIGDRVSEFGPWAEVLRDQPVPRGWIQRWESYRTGDTWELVAHGRGRSETITPTDVIYAIGTWPADPYGSTSEALQMSLFTRHPAVKPEPRKPTLRTWFGNED